MKTDTEQKHYMNPITGSVDTREGWYYENENGDTVNAVDLGEVIQVEVLKEKRGQTL